MGYGSQAHCDPILFTRKLALPSAIALRWELPRGPGRSQF